MFNRNYYDLTLSAFMLAVTVVFLVFVCGALAN